MTPSEDIPDPPSRPDSPVGLYALLGEQDGSQQDRIPERKSPTGREDLEGLYSHNKSPRHLDYRRLGLVKRKTLPNLIPSVLDFSRASGSSSASPAGSPTKMSPGHRVAFSWSRLHSNTSSPTKNPQPPPRSVTSRRPSTADSPSKASSSSAHGPKSSSPGGRRPSTASSPATPSSWPEFSGYRTSPSGFVRQDRRHLGMQKRSVTRASLFSSSPEGRRWTWSAQSANTLLGSDVSGGKEPRKLSFFTVAIMALQNRRISSGSYKGNSRRGSSLIRKKSYVDRTAKMTSVASFVGLQHRAHAKMSDIRSKELWTKLRLWCKIIHALLTMYRKYADYAMNDPASPFYSHTPGVEDLVAAAIDKDHYMFFDPANFKANRQRRMSYEVRRILTKPPDERTPDEVHFAMIGLRNIPQLAVFPVRMQRNFAQFGEFLCYEGKRMVLKQGHRAEGYYFILYGNVMVAVKNEETGFATTALELGRGEAFGELAIVSGGTRNSSVLTTTYTELLCISKQVYEAIFMTGGIKSINDPDQNEFLSSLPFLRGWPLEIITNKDSQKHVRFMYIQRNGVIMRDSSYNNWLVVVKSGSVTVLKKLVFSKPTVSTRTGLFRDKACTTAYQTFMINAKAYNRWLDSRNITLPPPFQLEEDSDEDEEEGEADNEEDILYEEEYGDMDEIFEDEDDFEEDEADEETEDDGEEGSQDDGDYREDDDDDANEAGKNKGSKAGLRPHTCGKGNVTASSVPRKAWSAKHPAPPHKPSTLPKRTRQKRAKIHFDEDDGDKQKEEKQVKDTSSDMKCAGFKRTLLDDLDAHYLTSDREMTEADVRPQFVYVHTLTKGDVFGLAPIVFPDQPSLCLVSNGAECMLIDKRFYMDHCPPDLSRRLKTQVSPYPSENKLQQDLVNRINWDVYKHAVKRQVWEQSPTRITMRPL